MFGLGLFYAKTAVHAAKAVWFKSVSFAPDILSTRHSVIYISCVDFQFTFKRIQTIIIIMSFIRNLDKKQITALHSEKNSELFNLLKSDIKNGVVFPAIRKNQIYFYYEGGCLYKFSNSVFSRDKQYEKYGHDQSLSSYELSKKQIENKFTNAHGDDKERRLLNSLYSHTFNSQNRCNVVVLDIVVNLNGSVACGKNAVKSYRKQFL